MTKFSFILTSCLILIAPFSYAQLSKVEAKEWKKKMKELDVESYKKLVEDKEAAETNVLELTEDNTKMISEVSQLRTTNAQLQTEVDDLNKAAQQAAEKLAAEKAADTTSESGGSYGMYTKSAKAGVQYKVQIGAYKKFDITKYFNNNKNFSGDVDDDGTMKYTLGEFNDYWEADKFKGFLREMGVLGAWVVAYKDGKRINMKEAREGGK